jgi:hypothetical protein
MIKSKKQKGLKLTPYFFLYKKSLWFLICFNFNPHIFNFLQTTKLFFFCEIKPRPNIKMFY